MVAVDIPSGVDGLTGAVQGTAVQATSTVTFAARKPGLVFEPGRSPRRAIRVVDIGIDLGPDGADPPPIACYDGRRRAPAPAAPATDAHKWVAGVMVVGGSGGMTGAPMFVSHAAMRAGAGMVWCGLPGDAAAARAGGFRGDHACAARHEGRRARAACRRGGSRRHLTVPRASRSGPGSAPTLRCASAVFALVAEARVPLVLDADGLNALNGDLEPLRTRQTLGVPTIVTPHDGEYARLAGQPVGDDRIAAAQRLADRSSAVVLLKGPGTVIAEPRSAAGRAGSRSTTRAAPRWPPRAPATCSPE